MQEYAFEYPMSCIDILDIEKKLYSSCLTKKRSKCFIFFVNGHRKLYYSHALNAFYEVLGTDEGRRLIEAAKNQTRYEFK